MFSVVEATEELPERHRPVGAEGPAREAAERGRDAIGRRVDLVVGAGRHGTLPRDEALDDPQDVGSPGTELEFAL